MKHHQIMTHDLMKITVFSVLRMLVLQDPTGCYNTHSGGVGERKGSSPGPKGKGEAPREGKRTGRFGGREADYHEGQELEPRSVAGEALTGFSATVGRPVKTAPEKPEQLLQKVCDKYILYIIYYI